jgi:hypothetical protein
MPGDSTPAAPTTRGTEARTTRGTPGPAPSAPATVRGGGAVRRRSTYVPGDRVPLGRGAVVVDDFIAASGEAELYRAHVDDSEPVADILPAATIVLKVYHHGAEANPSVLALWAEMRGNGVLRLLDYGVLEPSGRAYELVEYAQGGSLSRRLPIRDVDQLSQVLEQTAEGLEALHQREIIHRDLKPDNLLCLDPAGRTVVLADFGVATVLGGRSLVISRAGFGTPEYMAPEQSTELYVDGAAKNALARSVDYYALGITLLVCWTGSSPFGPGPHTAAELLAIKQHGRVPIPDDLPERWRRLLRALLAVDPSRRLDYAGVRRWMRGETIDVPETPSSVVYPPLVFRTERGEDVRVADPLQLATLLEQNPFVGRKFLYGKYVERAGWDAANPGLCAALTNLIEESYPRDQAAGLTAALYTLDPGRPYRAAETTVDTYAGLADHLAQEAGTYRDALRDPTHRAWLYLASRPDPRVRDGMPAQIEAFAAEPSTEATRSTALHRLILWLRALDGDRTLTFGGARLEAPAEILSLPDAVLTTALQALAAPSSLLSVWVGEMSSELGPILARWRATATRDASTLPYALGFGVPVGPGEVRIPADAVSDHPEMAVALWEGPAQARDEVARYLETYHDTPLVQVAFEWLRTAPQADHVVSVVRYVAGELDDLLALRAASGRAAATPGTTLPVPSEADAVGALFAQIADDTVPDWAQLATLTEDEPWRLLVTEVIPVLVRALDDAEVRGHLAPGDRDHVLDALAARVGSTLDAPSRAAPLRLYRLAAWMHAVAATPALVSTHGAARELMRRLDGVVEQQYRQGYTEMGNAPSFLGPATAAFRAVLPTLVSATALPFGGRFAEEERAYTAQLVTIHGSVAEERRLRSGEIDTAESKALTSVRKAESTAGPVADQLKAAKREWRLVAALGAGLVLLVFAVVNHGLGTLLGVAMGVVTGIVAVHRLPRLAPQAAFGSGAITGFMGFSLLVNLGVVSGPALLALLVWRGFIAHGLSQDAATALEGVGLGHQQVREFKDKRNGLEERLANRERAWALATRRAIALAPDVGAVDVQRVREEVAK